MASEPPVADYDACVLYPFHLRNVLVQCAVDGLVEARWTDDIHAEWMRNLAGSSPGTTLERLERTRDLMKVVLPDADVAGYQDLIPSLSLPDPDDRHVLAAAIAGKASLIVTWNLRHFPTADLRSHGVATVSPDDFLVGLHATFRNELIASVRRSRLNLRKTLPPVDEFINALKAQGLIAFSRILRRKAAKPV
jgi:predicted nucleic acid-binding protein